MSVSDESDLTDISDDEFEESSAPLPPPPVPSTQPALRRTTRQNSKGKRPQEMGVPHAVISPKTSPYSLRQIYDWLRKDKIDLDPEYQRDVVWSELRQSGLIDSLLRGCCVPPLIFAVKHVPNRAPTRTCIDGKQRLTSIFRFFEGQIPVRDSHTTHKFFYTRDGERPCLNEEARDYFDQLSITCFEYDNITIEQEREIFHRVQMGVPLTPAERMRANNGPYTGRIHKVCARLDASPGYKNLSFNGDRGKDFQVVAQMFWIVSACKGMPTIQKLETWLGKTEDMSSTVINAIDQAVDIFCALLEDDSMNAVFHHEKVSILQFIMILFYIHIYASKMSMAMLANGIGSLRAYISGKRNTLNSTNYTASERYVRGLGKKPFPEGDGEDDTPAAQKIKKIMALKAKNVVMRAKSTKSNEVPSTDVNMDSSSSKKRNEAGPSQLGTSPIDPAPRKVNSSKRTAPSEPTVAPKSKSVKAKATDSPAVGISKPIPKTTKKPAIANAPLAKPASNPRSRLTMVTAPIPSPRSAPVTPVVPTVPQYPSPAPEAITSGSPPVAREASGLGVEIPTRLSPCLPARLANITHIPTPDSRPSSLPPIDILPHDPGMSRVKEESTPTNVSSAVNAESVAPSAPTPLPRRSRFEDTSRAAASSNTPVNMSQPTVSAPQDPRRLLPRLFSTTDVTMKNPPSQPQHRTSPAVAGSSASRVDVEMARPPAPMSASRPLSSPIGPSPNQSGQDLYRGQLELQMSRDERERYNHARMAEGSIALGQSNPYLRRSFTGDDRTKGRSSNTDHSPPLPFSALPQKPDWAPPRETSSNRAAKDPPKGFLQGNSSRRGNPRR